MNKELSGKQLANHIKSEIESSTKDLRSNSIQPTLAVVIATDNESAHYYAEMIERAAENVGISPLIVDLGAEAAANAIAQKINDLAGNSQVHGIILQTPLADNINADDLRSLIPLEKDIDGANPLSAGRMLSGLDAFSPATPAAVMEILHHYDIKLKGTRAVIVGRSRVVGKPLAHLLLAADATVTICHSKTEDLAAVTGQADILVVAAGKPKLINGEHIKRGAVVVDVGTTVDETGQLLGDVDSESVAEIAGAITPVPGGVGPITTALLLRNTVHAAKKSSAAN